MKTIYVSVRLSDWVWNLKAALVTLVKGLRSDFDERAGVTQCVHFLTY